MPSFASFGKGDFLFICFRGISILFVSNPEIHFLLITSCLFVCFGRAASLQTRLFEPLVHMGSASTADAYSKKVVLNHHLGGGGGRFHHFSHIFAHIYQK